MENLIPPLGCRRRYPARVNMDEIALIARSVGTALLCTSIWLVPPLIYRKLAGIPLVPPGDSEGLDLQSLRVRAKLILTVVASFGLAAWCFAANFPISGVFMSLAGLFVLVWFQLNDTDSHTDSD